MLRSAAIVLVLSCLGGVARAGDYRAPLGFNGHQWGERLSSYNGLTLWRANTAINSGGKLSDSLLMRQNEQVLLWTRADGEGSWAVGEYYFDKDTNPWVAQRIELATISYLFCARWFGDFVPKRLNKSLSLCGVRMMFRSDTTKQLEALGEHYRSNFDKVLRELIVEFGEPPGYERSPTITVETDTQRIAPSASVPTKSDYVRYRWCGVDADAQQLWPSCGATVTLVFDGATGLGTILYATDALYGYAYARYDTGERYDELYQLLNGERLDSPKYYVKRECTGTHICGPRKQELPLKDAMAFKP